MLRIDPEACRVDGNKLIVHVVGDTLSELLDNDIAKLAIDNAHHFGWGGSCLNGMSNPMPKDKSGQVVEDYAVLAKLANEAGITYFREVYLVQPFRR